ncbi:hypothetical protein D3C87_1697400 [compost metagenome]
MVVEPFIGSLQSFVQGRAADFADQIVDGFGGQRTFVACKHESSFAQLLTKYITQHDFVSFACPRAQRLLRRQEVPAEIAE